MFNKRAVAGTLLAGLLMTKVGYAGVIARFMGRSVIPAASENLGQFAAQGGGAVESLAESFSSKCVGLVLGFFRVILLGPI